MIYAIWASPFHINRIRYSPHYYIDFTFIKPIGMLQTMIIMYIDLYTGIKIPGSFIIINSKSQIAYEKVLEDFYRIITNNNTIPIALQSYTIDYEIALENSLKKILLMQGMWDVFSIIFNVSFVGLKKMDLVQMNRKNLMKKLFNY